LTIRQQQTVKGTSFVIKDPVSGQYFRFRETEQFIARQLDGETPLEVVRQRTEEKFQGTLAAGSLDSFIKRLEKTGLLETEETTKKERAGGRGRLRGSPLYLRFKVFDPDKLFDSLIRRARFFFTPHFMVLSAALILVAVATTIANWSEFTQSLPRLYRLSTIPLFMAMILLIVSAHEFAHGLTCKHFGGEVHEIGFLLLYFQPAFYCNVSDAWLFPEKSKRFWVSFAGPYFELCLWAVAALAWRLTDGETWINYLALIVMTLSGFKTLFNFQPFLKLDGYYLLSDYLEIPNLRRKSFRYVGRLIERLFGFARPIAEEVSRREQWIYLVYGLVATVTSFSIVGYILVTAGGYLVEGHQPMVVLLSTSLLAFKFRRRFRRLFGKGSAAPDPLDDFEDFDPSDTGPLAEPAGPESAGTEPTKPPSRRWIKWSVVAVATLAVLFLGRLQLRVVGPFNILPRENADVRATVEGIVEKIYVDEGDQVKEGEVIARLSDLTQRAELQKVEGDLEAKRARLKMLLVGPRPEEVEVARKAVETAGTKRQQALNLYLQAKRARDERLALNETTVKKAEERLQFAEKNLKIYQTLVEEGLGARKLLDEAAELFAVRKRELEEARAQGQVLLAEDLAEVRKDVAVTEKEMKEAEGKLQVLLAGSRREEIQALQGEINRSEAEQAFLRQQLAGSLVVSPATGIVATPSRALQEMNYHFVKVGDLIAKVDDVKTVTAQIIISEKEFDGVRVGEKVVLRARAYPNETFYGTVTSIATTAQGESSGGEPALAGMSSGNPASANKTIVVATQSDNRLLLLKPEMTGQAKIFCGPRRIVDLITRRVARTFKVEFWSWW